MKLIIDNTSTPGTFFDNINNTNMLVNEYIIEDVSEIENFKDEILKTSKVYIKEDLVDENGLIYYESGKSLYSTTKYDYINEDTLETYRTNKLDKLYKTFNDNFKLTKSQFNNFHYFNEEHHNCKVNEDGSHKFGTIGGGTSLIFEINYCSEEMFPKFAFKGVKCHACNKISQLTGEREDYDRLEKDYEAHIKYGPDLNEVEFYRFMNIYYEYKSHLEIGFMGTGLGYLISVKVKDFVFDITYNTHW